MCRLGLRPQAPEELHGEHDDQRPVNEAIARLARANAGIAKLESTPAD